MLKSGQATEEVANQRPIRPNVRHRRHADGTNAAPSGRPLRPPAPAMKGLAAAAPSIAPPCHHRHCHGHLHSGTRHGRGAIHLIPPPPETRFQGQQATPPRPGRCNARGNQQGPQPPTSPRCLPTSSSRLVTAAPINPNPTPRQNPYQCMRVSYSRAQPTPHAPPRRRPMRTPPGPPPPPVPMSPPHLPTSMQLLELRKWARAEPSLEGLVYRPHRESQKNRRLQPAGGWMPQDAWEPMLADALELRGVHLHNLSAPQDHPYVPSRLCETSQAMQRAGRRLWDITRSPPPPRDNPWPPHKRGRADAGRTNATPNHSTLGTPRTRQHDTPDTPSGGALA